MQGQRNHGEGGWVDEIFTIRCMWVEWAVPPRTCGHGGSVGALHTPKLCASDLNNRPRGRDKPFDTGRVARNKRSRKLEAVGAPKPE